MMFFCLYFLKIVFFFALLWQNAVNGTHGQPKKDDDKHGLKNVSIKEEPFFEQNFEQMEKFNNSIKQGKVTIKDEQISQCEEHLQEYIIQENKNKIKIEIDKNDIKIENDKNSDDKSFEVNNSILSNRSTTDVSDSGEKAERPRNFSNEKKRKIVDKFMKMKKEYHAKYPTKLWNEINQMAAEQLPVKISTIFLWKSEFGLSIKQEYSDQEKGILMNKYCTIKKQNPTISDAKIAKKLKLGFGKLKSWKAEDEFRNQTNINRKKIFSLNEKKLLLQKFYKIKERYPKLGAHKIGKHLKVSATTLKNWKKSLKLNGKESLFANLSDNYDEVMPRNTEKFCISSKAWRWNGCTKKRQR